MRATLVALLALCVGCTVGEVTNEKHATAQLVSKSGSTVTGTAMFKQTGATVSLTLTIGGASAGMHGVHLHAVGDCSAADATSAMGHWDPPMAMHGLPSSAVHHLGDCGNIEVGADGAGTLNISSAWSIGTAEANDIVGKAIIVHANLDDGTTPPPPAGPGNSGARQACGVITVQ
jgi:superoxide dismutase, Cu-Zn family